MSTQVNGEVPRKETVMVGISSPAEAGRLARIFVDTVENLRSEPGYQGLAELVDRIPKLEADVREKEKALKKAGEELEDEKRTHAVERQTSLRLYAEESAHSKIEKVGLDKQITDLRSAISKKDEMITDLRAREDELKVLGRKMEETCKGKISQLKGKENELTEITERLGKSQKQNKTLSATLEVTSSKVTASKKSLDEAQQRNVQLEHDLKIVRGKLEELRSFSIPLEDTDSGRVAVSLNNVWESATTFVRKFLKQDLPDSLFERSWNALDDAGKFIMDTPLPQSNSSIAKELRIIKVLGILAEVIDKHMLQPTYQLSEDCQFRGLLYKLGFTEPNKQQFLRGMILSVLHDQRESAEDYLVNQAVKELMRDDGIENIIPPALVNDFVSQLTNLLEDVQEVWRAAQYSTQIFASDFGYVQDAGSEWPQFKVETGNSKQFATYEVDDDPIVVFPRIYLVLPGEEPKPITAGAVICRSQIRAMIREEREKNRSAEQTIPRARNRSGRTLSMSNDARNGLQRQAFLSQTPASSERSGA